MTLKNARNTVVWEASLSRIESMYECLAHKVKWEEMYSLWRKSLDDRHGEMPNPKMLCTEYEKVVREQFGIPSTELMIFRCVWEEN